jgi:hypothetical protein
MKIYAITSDNTDFWANRQVAQSSYGANSAVGRLYWKIVVGLNFSAINEGLNFTGVKIKMQLSFNFN